MTLEDAVQKAACLAHAPLVQAATDVGEDLRHLDPTSSSSRAASCRRLRHNSSPQSCRATTRSASSVATPGAMTATAPSTAPSSSSGATRIR
ncbi:MAG: hypothetical protein R2695_15470 [Acidimicrobiales bacterium]